MELRELNAELGLPWGLGKVGGVWAPDEQERLAAWEMLIELSTRVATVQLPAEQGLLREALDSLYCLFDITREILRRHGPSVSRPRPPRTVSFAFFAIAVLNAGLRPMLSYWHPVLSDYEQERPPGASSLDWETAWDRSPELRRDLDAVRTLLTSYAGLMADVCDCRSLLVAIDFRLPKPPGSQQG